MKHVDNSDLFFGPGLVSGSISEQILSVQDGSKKHYRHKPYSCDFNKPLEEKVAIKTCSIMQ